MDYIIGIDIGTSGTRAVLFDEDLNIISSASEEYPLYQPQNGWAEQNPEDWAKAAINTIKTIMTSSSIDKENVKGIGLSGQMHGLVMLDEDNLVIRPAIIWADQRTEKECDEITEKVGRERLIEITANPALTGFTASKILWVKNNEPDNYARCRHILLPKDYVRFILTGAYATDVSDASGMQLLDVPKRQWSDEILEILEIDRDKLAKVYESPEITGMIKKSIAEEAGLKEGTIVVAGAGDNAAAAVGTGVVTDGSAFTTIGTSGVVYAHSSKVHIDPNGRVHTFCCAVPNSWHVMGVTQAAGLSLRWLRDNIYKGKDSSEDISYDLINKDIEDIEIGSEKLLYLPYLMGERTPHLDPNARGVFFGLSAKHDKRNLARSVMEGVSFSLRDCYDILLEMSLEIDEMMITGGGARSRVWRQMLADIFNCNVRTIESEEGASLGAAILAGVGAGIFESVESACERYIRKGKEIKPDEENHRIYDGYYDIYGELYDNLKNSFKRLSEI
ncbi:xylulokinase [Tissierellaceae bacterium HCP3S3_D8]